VRLLEVENLSCTLTVRCHSVGEYDSRAIEIAVVEGITLAETAYEVLQKNYGTDKKVQQMVKYILGDDASLPGRVKKAKGERTAQRSTDQCWTDRGWNRYIRRREGIRQRSYGISWLSYF